MCPDEQSVVSLSWWHRPDIHTQEAQQKMYTSSMAHGKREIFSFTRRELQFLMCAR